MCEGPQPQKMVLLLCKSFFVISSTMHLASIYLPQLGANSPQPLVHKPSNFMVARTSLMSELVLATIKFGMAPLEVGPEFVDNV